MPLDIDTLATAVKAQLDASFTYVDTSHKMPRMLTIAAAGTPEVTVYARVPHTPMVPPAMVVEEISRRPYTMTEDQVTMRVTCYVELRDESVARQELRHYITQSGLWSVESAIEGDPTLGGIVSDCHVFVSNATPRMITLRNRQLYSVSVDLVVIPKL